MASVNETKKLVLGIGSKMSGLSQSLGTSREQFESAKATAETVVGGSASAVEVTLVGRLNQASEYADSAKTSVEKAIEACRTYADKV